MQIAALKSGNSDSPWAIYTRGETMGNRDISLTYRTRYDPVRHFWEQPGDKIYIPLANLGCCVGVMLNIRIIMHVFFFSCVGVRWGHMLKQAMSIIVVMIALVQECDIDYFPNIISLWFSFGHTSRKIILVVLLLLLRSYTGGFLSVPVRAHVLKFSP